MFLTFTTSRYALTSTNKVMSFSSHGRPNSTNCPSILLCVDNKKFIYKIVCVYLHGSVSRLSVFYFFLFLNGFSASFLTFCIYFSRFSIVF